MIHTVTINQTRAPSRALIMRLLGVSIEAGARGVILYHGKECMIIRRSGNTWKGYGALGAQTGHSVGRELQRIREFVQDHFIFVHVCK